MIDGIMEGAGILVGWVVALDLAVAALTRSRPHYITAFLTWVWRQNQAVASEFDRALAEIFNVLLRVLNRPTSQLSEQRQLERVCWAWARDPRSAAEHIDELEGSINRILYGRRCACDQPGDYCHCGGETPRPTEPPPKPVDAAWSASPGHPIWSQPAQTDMVARVISNAIDHDTIECPNCTDQGEVDCYLCHGRGLVRVA